MTSFWLLLIPYTTLAYGIHGGEFVQNINRQVRNLLCALPFMVVGGYLFGPYGASIGFLCGFAGSNLGFDNHRLWVKGFLNLPPFGALLLPFAYQVGKRFYNPPVFSEYFSGFLYGITLFLAVLIKGAL